MKKLILFIPHILLSERIELSENQLTFTESSKSENSLIFTDIH